MGRYRRRSLPGYPRRTRGRRKYRSRRGGRSCRSQTRHRRIRRAEQTAAPACGRTYPTPRLAARFPRTDCRAAGRERALLRIRISCAGLGVNRRFVSGRTACIRRNGHSADREKKLSLLGRAVGGAVEDSEGLAGRFIERAEALEPHADIGRQTARDLPVVLNEKFVLLVARAVDLFQVVLTVAVEVPGKRVGERVAGIDRAAEIRTEEVGAGRVVDRI